MIGVKTMKTKTSRSISYAARVTLARFGYSPKTRVKMAMDRGSAAINTAALGRLGALGVTQFCRP